MNWGRNWWRKHESEQGKEEKVSSLL